MLIKFRLNLIIYVICGCMLFISLCRIINKPSVMAESDISGSFAVIMYHHITLDKNKTGDYVITQNQLEEDFVYLAEQGYVTLSLRDLYAINNGEKALPEKSVMLTFDDGQESFYEYAFPLLKKFNFKAVFSVIGRYLEEYSKISNRDVSYSHATYDQIKKMVESGLVEIANHSYNLHKNTGIGRDGVTIKRGESKEKYIKEISEDIKEFNKLFEENMGFIPTAYTYPFGRFSAETEEIIKSNGFTAAFTCFEERNVPNSDKDWLFKLGRFNRPAKISTNKFFAKMQY